MTPTTKPQAHASRQIRALLASAGAATTGQRREGDELRPLGKKATRTRKGILTAAYQCVIDNGYQATSVQDIHGAAGVSIGTFYQYFRDKADVMAAIVGENILHSAATIFPPLDLAGARPSPRAALEGFVRYYASTADFQRVWEEVTHFDERLARLRWDLSAVIEHGFRDEIAEGQRAGRIDGGLDPELAARALAGMVDRHCYLTFVVDNRRDDVTIESSIETLAALWENALGLSGLALPSPPP